MEIGHLFKGKDKNRDKPCIRGIRVTVSIILGFMASGHYSDEIFRAYPYLEIEDLTEALEYAMKILIDLNLLKTSDRG